MHCIILLFVFAVSFVNSFTCPNANGSYVNPNDYRSYYLCSNRCPTLQYCTLPGIYFTRTNQTCISEPPDWRVRFDLSGRLRSGGSTDVFIEQNGYGIYISRESVSTHSITIARYINETHAIGIQTVHQLINHCIVVFNARVIATNNRAHCFYVTLHPFSSRCDLPENYSGDYCTSY